MNERSRLALVLRVLIACVALASIGTATAAAEKRVRFNIAPQDLLTALTQFARQSDQELLFSTDVAASKRTGGVTGEFAPTDALRALLEGTGLGYRVTNENTILIERTGADATDRRAETTSSVFRTPLVLAQVTPALQRTQQGTKQRTQQGTKSNDESPQAAKGGRDEVQLGDMTITGSHIRGGETAGSKVIVVGREDIDESGYATVQDVLRTLPQNFSGSQSETTRSVGSGAPNESYGSSVNLRGLGADATLTLVNGRRLAPAGTGTFVDISAVPLSMIERIEIVPDGASATYGSDAIGGVVNIVLRKNFDGAETRLRYGALSGGDAPEQQFAQVFGKSWASGNVLVGYEYHKRDPLASADRRYTTNSDLRPLGGSNFSSTQSNPGNITRIGTTAVNLAVPSGQNGTALSESQFATGQPNLLNLREADELLPEQKRNSAVLFVSQTLGERVELFADAVYSERDFVAADNQQGTTITIPQSNAYRILNNLFPGQGNITMAYNFTDDLGPSVNFGEAKTRSGTAGATFRGAGSWNAQASATYADTSSFFRLPNRPDATALAGALASSNRDTAFNPFADGSNTNASVLSGLRAPIEQDNSAVVRSLNAKADGALIDLPAGPVKLAVGGELREERFDFSSITISAAGVRTPTGGALVSNRRTVRALFGEVYVPFFSEQNARPAMQRLDLSLSARYENYTDVGEKTSPKLGLRWVPLNGLTMRGSYGESFKAPFLRDLSQPSLAVVNTLPAILDPGATGGSTVTLLRGGGNRNLKPETAESWTFAVQVEPPSMEGLKIGLGYFSVSYDNRVSGLGSVLPIFTNPELYPGVLIRNPTQAQVDALIAGVDRFLSPPPAPGSIEAILDVSLRNLAVVEIEGVDFDAGYEWSTRVGSIRAGLNASYLFSFDEKFSSTAPVAENVDRFNKPVDMRARGGVTWSQGGLAVSGFVNYVDQYEDTLSVPSRKIASWTTADLQVRYDTTGRGGWLADTVFSLSAVNVLDKSPPFANNPAGFGFDPANASPLGRFIALDVSRAW